jgi:hypothetical protein
MRVSLSRPLPSFQALASLTRSATNRSWTLSWTRRREPAQHIWPAFMKMPKAAPLTALSRLASGKTMLGLLPPSSSVTGTIFSAASLRTIMPVGTLPVTTTPAVAFSRTRTGPILAPLPVMTLKTPLGTPASSMHLASLRRERGVSLAGLATTVLPAARAGAMLRQASWKG